MRNCHLLMTVLVVLAVVSAGASAQFVNYDLFWADITNGDIWAYPDTVGTVISPSASFSSVTSLAITRWPISSPSLPVTSASEKTTSSMCPSQ